MNRLAIALAFAALAATSSKPPFELSDAPTSPDALVQRLIAALEKNDETALHAVRVNEREYRELIAPGTVPQGNPPRETDAKVTEFYWRMVDAKSRDLGRELLKAYGGQRMTIVSIEYTKQPLEYAWYHAQGEVRVHVKNSEGKEAVVPAKK